MNSLKLVYVATLTKYNMGDPFITTTKDFDHDPTPDEVLTFLNETDARHKNLANFATDIKITKVYKVI